MAGNSLWLQHPSSWHRTLPFSQYACAGYRDLELLLLSVAGLLLLSECIILALQPTVLFCLGTILVSAPEKSYIPVDTSASSKPGWSVYYTHLYWRSPTLGQLCLWLQRVQWSYSLSEWSYRRWLIFKFVDDTGLVRNGYYKNDSTNDSTKKYGV